MKDDGSYEPVLSSKATSVLLGLSKSKQREVFKLIYQIASFPFQYGDYAEVDPQGRTVQFLMLGEYVIGFWSDHAVRELRIVEIDEV